MTGKSSPHLSVETKSDDGYSLVFKLSEDDPLVEKKKRLLPKNGYESEIRVFLSRFESSEWAKYTLQEALRFARIIHLDETELYFGRVDQPLEYYSPKNELESLNSILSQIDNLLSSSAHKRTGNLHELHDVTVDMIRDFGDKNCEEVKTEKCSCGPEETLLEWGKKNGARTRLQIAHVEGAGRGVVASEDLKIGDSSLEIPESMIICEEVVYESDMFHILKNIDNITTEKMLLLWSMKERYYSDSKFKIYFETLPGAFNTGLNFGIDALTALEGTMLFDEIMHAKEHLRIQYEDLFPILSSFHPDVFPPELYTWEQFLWACELWYSNGMEVIFTDGKLRTCLVPLAGLFNHSLCPHILHYGKVDSATKSLKFSLSRPCREGEQCYLSYGNFSSSHLLTFYGFLPNSDNPNDVIQLDIDDQNADDSRRLLSDWTTHMVRGTWLSTIHDFFYYGLPPPLLDHLRGTIDDDKMHPKAYKNLRNEVEVLNMLISIFSPMMDEFADPEDIIRENLNWDLKLALDYKDLQRRIISSVLDSCSAGLELLNNQLSKRPNPNYLCTQKNLRNEVEVLNMLISIFSPMMDEFADPEDIIRENLNWDLKLALDYKDLQRRIISSVLDSCSAGLELLNNQLSKRPNPN
ncbi:uncharacterized protein LOC122069136 [Macadamia integrifolia]|uniref:uncharacterized protein LOC122069136 n=1 Tax=Macadamia integrifolia TaxID=60698 RepID=UPI001C4E93E3|nr:uncharacterized protein LOC122069136 [Macadamia integrifolia]